MMKYLIVTACAVSLASVVYLTGFAGNCGAMPAVCDDCCAPSAESKVTSSPTAAEEAAAVDVKNTKCLVSGDDPMGAGAKVVYKGKLYHLCCESCLPTFNKDPEKYVQAFEADPAKFGVKK
jgi:YHS domain-containing protein